MSRIMRRDVLAGRAAPTLAGAGAVVAARRPKAVATWGLTDRYSWINDTFPRKDSAQARPMPLDSNDRPKPMMTALERYRKQTG